MSCVFSDDCPFPASTQWPGGRVAGHWSVLQGVAQLARKMIVGKVDLGCVVPSIATR